MSIATAITNLTNDRANIRTALVNQGITEASDHGFSSFAADIAGIVSGSYAFILATYPEGSTITCTKDSTTASSKAISTTEELFYITEAGTWTVTCTDGTDTATSDVEITYEGQSESIELSYWDGHIYYNGNAYTSITGGWDNSSITSGANGYTAAAWTIDDTSMDSDTGSASVGGISTKNTIDLSAYSTITFTMSTCVKTNSSYGNGIVCIGTTESYSSIGDNITSIGTARTALSNGTLTYTIDISAYTDSYYVQVMCKGMNVIVTGIKLS